MLLTFAVYFPGLGAFFMFDDTLNIVDNPHLKIASLAPYTLIKAAFSGGAGILARPVSTLSFALDYYFSGMKPEAFKLTNLFIHLLNGVAVFGFMRLLLEAHRHDKGAALSAQRAGLISAAIAAAWLVHPLNLTSVLYPVQRMTSLAALFTLLGLCSFLLGRLATSQRASRWGWAGIGASFLLLTPLATLSKESGALLPLFLLLTELVFFRFRTATPRAAVVLKWCFGIAVVLPVLVIVLYTLFSPTWITNAYLTRSFTMGQRLMTETRVVWLYLQMAIAPSISTLGLFHDDLPLSTSLIAPLSTLWASAGLLALAAGALALVKRQPVAAFGVLFFLLGHVMESTAIGLELVHEHRNYLPLIGLLLVVIYFLLGPSARVENRLLRPAAVAGIIALLAGVTFLRATAWGDPFTMKNSEVAHHPDSIRANIDLASFYAATPGTSQQEAQSLYDDAYKHYAKASSLSPSDTLGLFGLITMSLKQGQPLEAPWLPVLAARIEHFPVSPDTVNSLLKLERCFSEKQCHATADMVETLLTAALRNPTLRLNNRAQILFAWSGFQLSAKNDVEAATRSAIEAGDLIPNDLEAQVQLIILLMNMHQNEVAATRLHALRQRDRLHLKTDALDALEAALPKITTAR